MPYRLLSCQQVAEYLHLSLSDVKRMVRGNEIPFVQQGEKAVFRKKDVDLWASQRILGFSKKHLSDYHKRSSVKHHDLSKNRAIVPELLHNEALAPRLESKTKASLLRDMAGLAERTSLVYDAVSLLNGLVEREKMGTTALPGGIALLHPPHHEPFQFQDSFIGLGRTAQPIPFGSPDGSVTDLFFLICCQEDRIHLHVLARLCMMCQQTSLVLELRDAPDAAAMRRILIASEEEIIQRYLPGAQS